MTTIKSIHIKECWPYEYVKPDRRVFKRETMDRANARKREQYQVKKLLKLKVYELDIDFCNRLNDESKSQSRG
jgi:hypothetical protein